MTAIQPSSSLRRQSLATFRGLQNTTFTETGQLRTAKKVACDRCRGQKLRCVWDPRSSKCRRCTRAKAVCIILPPRPMGRPSCGDRNKRDRRDNRNACTRDTQADPAASMLYRNNPPNGYTTVHNEPGVLSDVESGTGTGINPSNAVAVVDPLIPAPMLPSSHPTHLTHRRPQREGFLSIDTPPQFNMHPDYTEGINDAYDQMICPSSAESAFGRDLSGNGLERSQHHHHSMEPHFGTPGHPQYSDQLMAWNWGAYDSRAGGCQSDHDLQAPSMATTPSNSSADLIFGGQLPLTPNITAEYPLMPTRVLRAQSDPAPPQLLGLGTEAGFIVDHPSTPTADGQRTDFQWDGMLEFPQPRRGSAPTYTFAQPQHAPQAEVSPNAAYFSPGPDDIHPGLRGHA